MRNFFTLLVVLGLSITTALGQASYQVSFSDGTGNPGGLNTEADAASVATWDTVLNASLAANTWSAPATIPFPFDFFGSPVTQYVVSGNGLLTFDVNAALTTPPVNANTDLPNALLPDSTIAAMWDEFTINPPTGTNDRVVSKTFGTAPDRQHWIKWFSYEIGGVGFSYFAIVLEEKTNRVYVVDLYSAGSPLLTTTVGVQLDASTAVQFGNDSIPQAGNGSGNADNDYWEFTPFTISPVDLGVTAYVSPDFDCFGDTINLVATVTNFGTQAIDLLAAGANLDFQITGAASVTGISPLTGTLASGASADFAFGLPVVLTNTGSYTIKTFTTVANDGNAINDTLEANFTKIFGSLLPVDFTGFSGGNLPTVAPGWSETEGTPPSGTFSSWTSRDFANAAGPNGTAAVLNLFGTFLDNELIVSPQFIPTATTIMTYDIALTDFVSTAQGTLDPDDTVSVVISTDCGVTFTPLVTYTAASTISATGQTDTVDLSAFAGQVVVIGFAGDDGTVSGTEDVDFFVDNINVVQQLSVDMGVSAVLSPTGDACYGPAELVQVEVTNFGTQPIDFSVNATGVFFQVAGPNANTYSAILNSGTLAVGATQVVDITPAGDFSLPGLNIVSAYTQVLSGADPGGFNDTTSISFETVPTVVAPYLEDFELFTSSTGTGDPGTIGGGWTRDPNVSAFAWYPDAGGTPSGGTGPAVDHSTGSATGIYMYTEGSNGGQFAFLKSPCIDISALTNPSLEFYYHMFGNNMGDLTASVIDDLGDTTVVFSASGQQQAAQADPYLRAFADLSAFAGQTIQLLFTGETGPGFATDMAIDDVNVFDLALIDFAALELVQPGGPGCYGSAEDVIASVVNFGTPIDLATENVTINVDIAGPTNGNFNVVLNTGTVNTGDTLTELVTSVADLSTPGIYTFTLTVFTPNDADASNNSLSFTVESLPVVTAPYLEDFDLFPSSTGTGNPSNLLNGWTRTPEGTGGIFTWFPDADGTPSGGTGPLVDHTQGNATGIYLYTEASNTAQGPIAEVFSPCIDLSAISAPALEFWYHMAGTNMGTLTVLGTNSGGLTVELAQFVGSQQGASADPWLLATASLDTFAGQTIQLIFRGERGNGFSSDMAIDDVRVYDLPAVDVGPAVASPLLEPMPVECFDVAEEVIASIQNFGGPLDLSVENVTVNVEITGPLAPQTFSTTVTSGNLASIATLAATVTSTADFSAGGIYDVEIIVSSANDANASNDTAVVTLENIIVPSAGSNLPPVTFDGFNGGNLPTISPGWFEIDGVDAPPIDGTTGFSSWTSAPFGNDAASPNGTAARLNIFSNFLDREWIAGPKFTVTAQSFLFYDLALTDFASTLPGTLGSDDTVMVMMSIDCGGAYFPIAIYDSSSVISNTGQTDSIDLSSFAGEEAYIAFVGDAGTVIDPEDIDFFLDNINIREVLPLDMAASAITTPSGDACFTTTEDIVVEVENQGTQTIDFATDNMTVTVEVAGPNANTYSTTVTSGTLASQGTQLVTVTTTADLSQGGFNDFTAYIDIVNDPNGINDTTTATIQTIPIVSIPYSEDFETFTAGNPGALANGWTRTSVQPGQFPWVPNVGGTGSGGTGPAGDHTTNFGGGVYMYTEASFPAVQGDVSTLSSPCIDLSGQTNPTLEFWYHMFGAAMGTLELDVIRVGGDTTNVFTATGQQQTSETDAWLRSQVDMTPFAGDTVILQWVGTMGSTFTSDMAIDDVRFIFSDDLRVASVDSLNNGRQLTSTQLTATNTVGASIVNVGVNPATNFPINLWLDGTIVATETITDTIQPGDTLAHVFSTTIDLSAPADYDVRAYTEYSIDGDNTNDTAQQIIRHVENAPVQLPYFEGFEGVTEPPLVGGTFAINGIDRFDHESSGNNGRVQFDLGFQRTGLKAASLESANIVTPDEINYLIATFNMSNFTASDSIFLDFYIANNGDEPDPNDRVWIRGSDTDAWIQFVDWTTIPNNNTYVPFTDINITKLLTDNGQAYSTSTQIRWGQEDNFPFTGPDGLNIDDIGLRKIFNFDAAATDVLAPSSGDCGSDTTFFTIDITNEGFVPLTSVGVTTEVTFPDNTVQTFNNTLTPANLALLFGESESIQVGPVNTSGGGTFKVTSYTTLSTDELNANDTVMAEIDLKPSIPPIVSVSEPVCEGDSAVLTVAPEDGAIFVLYDSPTDSVGLDTGDVFTVGPITTADTFYVGDVGSQGKVGAVDSTIGIGSYYFFFPDGLLFDVQQSIVLQDVRVYPDADTGTFVVNLVDGGGVVVESDTIPFGGTVTDTVLTLNWSINPGSYSINLDGSVLPGGVWRNQAGGAYPYSVPGVVDITGPINNLAGFYYFFYNWTVVVPPCPRDRREVVVAPTPVASAAFMADTSAGNLQAAFTDMSSGADSIRFEFGDGGTSSMSNPVYTYPDTGFYTVTLIAFSPCGNDTTTEEIFVSCNFPTAGFAASLDPDPTNLDLKWNFVSTSGNADSTFYTIDVNGTPTDIPGPNASFTFPGSGQYTVTITSFNICDTVTSTQTINVVQVGLDALIESGSLNIYPNPTEDILFLDMALLQTLDLNLEVVDMRGKKVYGTSYESVNGAFSHRFDLSDLAKGVYLLKIQVGDQVMTQKVQVE